MSFASKKNHKLFYDSLKFLVLPSSDEGAGVMWRGLLLLSKKVFRTTRLCINLLKTLSQFYKAASTSAYTFLAYP